MSFKSIATQALADAYKFPTEQSTVLHVAENNNVTVNGVNVVTKTPAVGDLLCVTRNTDSSGNLLLDPSKQSIVWIKGDTFTQTFFPKDKIEAVGVVYKVQGRTASVLYREAAQMQYAAANRLFSKSPYMSDGVAHAVDIVSVKGTTTTKIASNVTYQCNSVSAFKDWLKTKLASDDSYSVELYNTTGTIGDSIYVNCRLDGKENKLYIRKTGTTTDQVPLTFKTCAELGLTPRISAITPAYNTLVGNRCNGAAINLYSIDNTKAYINYSTVKNTANRAPSTTITSTIETDTFACSYNVFYNNSYCKLLRETYGDWETYLKSYMLKIPGTKTCKNNTTPLYQANIVADDADRGAEFTSILADVTYTAADGTATTLYPAANWCNSIGANQTELIAGKWYIPSAAELADIFSLVEWTFSSSLLPVYSDILNNLYKKLIMLKFTTYPYLFETTVGLSPRYIWSSSVAHNVDSLTMLVETTGYFEHKNAYNSYYVYPVTTVKF